MIRKISQQEKPGDLAQTGLGTMRNVFGRDLSVTYHDTKQPLIFKDIKLRPGFVLSFSDRPPSINAQTVHETENAAISLGFNLNHHVKSTVYSAGKRAEVFERSPGDYAFCYLPKSRCIVETLQKERVLGVSVHFSVKVFREIFQELPRSFQSFYSGPKDSSSFYRKAHINSTTSGILQQILACPYDGAIRQVFLEAKALELAAVALSDFEKKTFSSSLSHREEERVREAYHLLRNNLEEPPSLCELSRKVGINRNKLNDGFKRLYGNTVFNVLRKLRLHQACDLLVFSEKSLADIALTVGYSDQANFTTAFRRQFGKTPLAFRRKGIMPD
ncbi:helix-turn-helix domain-containing protein [Desulfogranum japonicum]|uniref:helix-turn-helix domain-containing protein n=1 Tax=Desulfogranum japonicum TaxID=231447 RepID=UPI000688120C|nr:AraC family transcriptional regulator [Desulfogranum japonicum]